MEPELFQRKVTYTFKSDVYSIGMIFWEIAARKLPFADAHDSSIIPSWATQGEREDIPEDCLLEIGSLIQQCWDSDPNKRPPAKDVMKHLNSSSDNFDVVNTRIKCDNVN